MFTRITKATIVLTGLLFASASSAVEVSVENLLSAMVSQAVSVTKQEISYGVQEAVLTANNMISMDEEVYATKVTITDINDVKNDSKVANDKAE